MPTNVAPLSLSIARGTARTYLVTHQVSALDATPINIAGWTIRVTVKDVRNRVVLSKPTIVVDALAGRYNFSVTHNDTNISAGPYRLDIQRIDAGAETLMGLGTLSITPEVLY